MKANELMIGDLLKWKEQAGFNDEDRNMVLRVKNIFDDAIKIDGRFGLYHISLFEPIPLTPEILEKNGFKYKEGETGMYGVTTAPHYICDGVPFEVFCDGEPFAIWFKEPINIKFVHQLQHALRLCGIEKEIEL